MSKTLNAGSTSLEPTEAHLQLVNAKKGSAGHADNANEVSAQKSAYLALAESEERFRLAIAATNDCIWDINLETGPVHWNERYTDRFGRPPESGDSWQWWIDHIHPDDRERTAAGLRAAIDCGSSVWTCEYRFLCADGKWADIYDRAYIARRPSGEAWRVIGSMQDQTGRKLAADAAALRRLNDASSRLWQVKNLREGLGEMLDAAIELLGADKGNIQLVDGQRGILTIEAQRGFEQPFLDFFKEVSASDKTACGRAFRAGERIIIGDVDADEDYAPFRAVAATAGYRAVQSTPLMARDGTALGTMSTHFKSAHRPSQQDLDRLDLYARQAADFIEHYRTQEALRQSEERLRFVAERAGVGYWYWEIEPDRLEWSPLCKQLFGIPVQEPMSYTRFIDAVHPEDRENADRAVRACLESGGDRDCDIEYRTLWPDGTVRWIHAKGSATFERNRPVQMAGIALDITERKQAEETLQIHRELLELVVGHMPVAASLIRGSDLRLQLVNPAYQAITPGKKMVGKTLDELWPETGKNFAEICRRVLQTGESHEVMDELNMVRRTPDGAPEPAYFSWSLHRVRLPGNEGYGLLNTAWETTARKLAEERVRLAMHEVNHRAKNMLMLVQAVARYTAATKPEDFLRRFEERLWGLAASQDLLVKNEWIGVSLEEIIKSQLAHFQDLVGTRIELSGPSLRINAPAAQALGMALHELATNAGKYGAISSESGRVKIRWSCEGTPDGEQNFSIRWRETGGPPVKIPESTGFGSTVLGRMIEDSLDAKVEFDYAPGGVTWRLHCRADSILERAAFVR